MFVCKHIILFAIFANLLSVIFCDNLGPVTAYAYYPTYQSTYPQTSSVGTSATSSITTNTPTSQSSALRPYYALYHQNVYPGPFYTYQAITPPQTTTYSSSNSAGQMITSASEMAAITHTERPTVASTETLMAQEGKSNDASKTKVNTGSTSMTNAPGVVFGRPLGGFDGYYYVPVY